MPARSEIDHARDVFYSVANQLAAAYCEANQLPPFPRDEELIGNGAKMEILPLGTVPSENSIIAAMMRARLRCVTSTSL